MSDVTISPNMLLPIPIPSTDPGPDWALNYSACLSAVDSHNHSTNNGVPISQDGISLTASVSTFDSLSFNASNAFALRSVRFNSQSAALALATDIGCLYESGVDLYYNDGAGNHIRLTQGGSIVGTAGSITGLPSGTASASFSGGTFVWQSATSTAANMDAGSYIYRNATASSKGLTLSPPNAMAADFQLFLPSIPGTQSIMSLDTSGNMAASYNVDNSTIVISSNVIKVGTGGITATQIAAAAVDETKLADSAKTNQPYNLSFTATVAANALTIALKDASGANPSGTSPVCIPFRNTTAATGTYVYRSVTGALSLVVPSGATLGTKNFQSHYLYVYAIDNAGTVQLGISQMLYDEGTLNAALIIGASSPSNSLIYSTSTVINVAIRCIGRILIGEATAGVWATAPTELVSMILPTVQGFQKICAIASGSNTSVSNNTLTNMRVTTTVFDNCGCMSTVGGIRDIFTAPQSKRYRFSVSCEFAYPSGGVTTFSQLFLYKNSSPFLIVDRIVTTTNGFSGLVTVKGSQDLDLSAGNTVEFEIQQQNGSSAAANSTNYFSIEEI